MGKAEDDRQIRIIGVASDVMIFKYAALNARQCFGITHAAQRARRIVS
jgi:hypothetical protein